LKPLFVVMRRPLVWTVFLLALPTIFHPHSHPVHPAHRCPTTPPLLMEDSHPLPCSVPVTGHSHPLPEPPAGEGQMLPLPSPTESRLLRHLPQSPVNLRPCHPSPGMAPHCLSVGPCEGPALLPLPTLMLLLVSFPHLPSQWSRKPLPKHPGHHQATGPNLLLIALARDHSYLTDRNRLSSANQLVQGRQCLPQPRGEGEGLGVCPQFLFLPQTI
jgi:hypothetical protein